MSSLVSIGLLFDIIGAVILLGPEYRPIEKAVKRVDPLYQSVKYGMNTFYRETTEIEDGTMTSGGEMDADRWEFFVARRFLNKRIEGRISETDTVAKAGVGIRKNGEEITLPEEHHGTVITHRLSTSVVDDWIENSQERRMYRVGGVLLVAGFSLQLLAQYIKL